MKSLPTSWFHSLKKKIFYHYIINITEEANIECHWSINFYDMAIFSWAYLWSLFMGVCIVLLCTLILLPGKWYKVIRTISHLSYAMFLRVNFSFFYYIVDLVEIGLPGIAGPHRYFLCCTGDGEVMYQLELEVMANIN